MLREVGISLWDEDKGGRCDNCDAPIYILDYIVYSVIQLFISAAIGMLCVTYNVHLQVMRNVNTQN